MNQGNTNRETELPPQARVGARVALRRELEEEPRDGWHQGTVVHVYPAVEHEHDCYAVVAWDDLFFGVGSQEISNVQPIEELGVVPRTRSRS